MNKETKAVTVAWIKSKRVYSSCPERWYLFISAGRETQYSAKGILVLSHCLYRRLHHPTSSAVHLEILECILYDCRL